MCKPKACNISQYKIKQSFLKFHFKWNIDNGKHTTK